MSPQARDALFLGIVLLAVLAYPAGYAAAVMPALLLPVGLDIAAGQRPWVRTAFDRPLLALLAAIFASALASEWREESLVLSALFGLTTWLSVYATARAVQARPDAMRLLVAAWIVGGVVAASWGILRWSPSLPEGATTPALLQTALGTSLAASAIVTMGLWTTVDRRLMRTLLAVGLLVVVTALQLTWSRGAWIAAVVGTAVMIVLVPRRRASLVALVLATVALSTTAIGPGRALLIRRMETVPSLAANLDRISIWTGAVRAFAAHPILGTGYGTFSRAWPRYRPAHDTRDVPTAHNLYLNFAVETGLVGLAGFLAFLGVALGGLWRRVVSARGDPHTEGLWSACFAAAVAMLVHQLFDGTVASVHMGFGFLALLALGQAKGTP
jgi:O-antigen ligase